MMIGAISALLAASMTTATDELSELSGPVNDDACRTSQRPRRSRRRSRAQILAGHPGVTSRYEPGLAGSGA
jgi:hypothetical protein